MPGEATSTRGRAGVLAVLTLSVATLVFLPTLSTLVEAWRTVHDYQHGYLVAAVAVVWLGIFTKQNWLERVQPGIAGAGLLAATLLAWLVGLNANSQAVHQILFPVALWSALLAVLGWRVARQAIAPVAFLYFAVPIWEYLLPVLQRMSVAATEFLLAALAVPAYVNEYTVTIPAGTFEVIEGCSGKRYLVTTAAIAVVAGYLNSLRRTRLAVLVGVSCALALVANWIRIVIIVYAGHVTEMQHHLVAVEHMTLGHVVLAVLIVTVALLARRLAPPSGTAPIGPAPRAPISQDPVAAHRSVRWAGVPIGLLLATLVTHQVRANALPDSPAMVDLPGASTDWSGPLPPRSAWMPDYHGTDVQVRGAYGSAAGVVEVYANTYAAQHQGRELILYRNTLLAPGEWRRPWPPTATRIAADGAPLAMFEARVGEESWVIAYAYEIGGWATTSEPLAQLAYGVRSFFGPVPSGVVALATPCGGNCEAARALVGAFWDDMSARMLALVPNA